MARQASDYPGAACFVPGDHSLEVLRAAAPGCRGCDLFRDATQVVFGDGAADAELMLVGEQPGDREDVQGEPFVGPAGRLLDSALAEAQVSRATTYATNAVKHFRFRQVGKQRIHVTPSRWQVVSCQPWLLAEIDALAPRVVVLLGATAGQGLYGASFRVGVSRGRLLDPPDLLGASGPAFVATVHPSSVLRSRERERDFAGLVHDLRIAAALLPAA